MKKNMLFVNTIMLMSLIILYYIVGSKSIFLYALSISLYNVFIACFDHITIGNCLKKLNSCLSKKKIYQYMVLTISVISLLFLLIGICVSDIISILININNVLFVFIMMGLSVMTLPIIKITDEYLDNINNKKKIKIINIYYVLDNLLLLLIAFLVFRIFKINISVGTGLLYLSKIISAMAIASLMYFINKKQKKDNCLEDKINYQKEIKQILVKDSYKSLVNVIKNSYYYISIIIIYYILTTRYQYADDVIERSISFIYLYSLAIINYLINLVKILNKELPQEMSFSRKLYSNFKIMLPIVIVFGIISPLTCKVIFNNPDYSIYLTMTNLMAIFILLYDITYENIENKKIILISLASGIITKIILIIPLINSFYRMGYNLIYGDILSTIIGMFISVVINYIYIKVNSKTKEKYFEKILDILYENIILAIILIVTEFIIPIDTNNYLKSIGLIVIYVMVGIIFLEIKNKKRG